MYKENICLIILLLNNLKNKIFSTDDIIEY